MRPDRVICTFVSVTFCGGGSLLAIGAFGGPVLSCTLAFLGVSFGWNAGAAGFSGVGLRPSFARVAVGGSSVITAGLQFSQCWISNRGSPFA